MTAHARALDLGGISPAFGLEPAETRELREHLRACPDCSSRVARMRADLAAIGAADPAVSPRLHDRIREAAVSTPRSGPSALGVVAILALLAIGMVGASLGVGALLARPRVPPPDGPQVAVAASDALSWKTDVVALAAKEFWIEADGVRFVGAAKAGVVSDPGNLDRWTLEARWMEQGREERLTLSFAGDVGSWWIGDIRVYDGSTAASGKAEWVAFAGGPWAKTPRGEAFEGDLDLTAKAGTGPVTLHLADLRIAVSPADTITEPIGGGITLAENQNPFAAGGALYCSGVLALPPQQAELRLLAMGYKLSWRWQYVTSRFEGGATGFAEVMARAPATGYISDSATGSDGELIVFVEDPARPMDRAPWPAVPPGCPTPTSP